MWLIIGRRSGKSRICAMIAVDLACFFDYRQYLSPGEWGLVSVTANDRKQARNRAPCRAGYGIQTSFRSF